MVAIRARKIMSTIMSAITLLEFREVILLQETISRNRIVDLIVHVEFIIPVQGDINIRSLEYDPFRIILRKRTYKM